MMLYKYADWNDHYTKENLKNSQLGFNTPENFNDPFDIFARFKIKNRDIAIERLSEYAEIPIKFVKQFDDENLILLSTEKDRSHLCNINTGITCFSNKYDNILMWSHYANKHKGICLGFDINKENLTNFIDKEKNISEKIFTDGAAFKLEAITYTEDRPIFYIMEKNNIEDILFRKNKVWETEDEYRLIIHETKKINDDILDRIYFPTGVYYNTTFLKEIILGANMPLGDYSEFYIFKRDKLNNDIKIFLNVLDLKKYKLNRSSVSNAEQEQLYINYKFLRDNIPGNIVDNYYEYSCREDNIYKYWLRTINDIRMYNLKTYYPFIFEENLNDIILNKYNYNINTLYDKIRFQIAQLLSAIRSSFIYNIALDNKDKEIPLDLYEKLTFS